MTKFEELQAKFNVQNMCTFAQVHTGTKIVKVANWVSGANVWAITPEGEALLDEPAVVESADTLASTPKRAKKAKVEAVVEAEAAVEPDLELDDL